MKDILLKSGLNLFKPKIEKLVEETNFVQLVMDELTEETKKAVFEKFYEVLIDNLKNLDNEQVAKLAINAKEKLVDSLETNKEILSKVFDDSVTKVLLAIENDEEFQEKVNSKLREKLLEQLEKFIEE
ncbi:hypothetical protein [Persephonella sp. KM09-Lau-8]|uniref:hypothetical protein n=1 Tax=Persephonella sp. KM09-Lau-8 TaxID=1158345 RepID=UPI000497E3D9|nr:hypothetical protein [Persephonella sp. KM09-Lau-8]